MVAVDLLIATAVLAGLPFLAGLALGVHLHQYRMILLVVTGIPTIYFVGNFLIALEQQGLQETLVIGIPLGTTPLFIMFLTAITLGSFIGLLASNWW